MGGLRGLILSYTEIGVKNLLPVVALLCNLAPAKAASLCPLEWPAVYTYPHH